MIPKQNFYNFFQPLILASWALNNTVTVPTVYWAYPNAPEPLSPAFSIRATLTATPDHSHLGDVDDNGNQTVSDNSEATITITGVGKGTYAALEDLATSCRKQSAIRAAATQGIALIDRPRITDVTGLLNRIQAEERGQLTVSVRFVNTVSDNVGWIDTVNMQGTFEGGIQPSQVQDMTVDLDTTP
jgi:hypothetical protein